MCGYKTLSPLHARQIRPQDGLDRNRHSMPAVHTLASQAAALLKLPGQCQPWLALPAPGSDCQSTCDPTGSHCKTGMLSLAQLAHHRSIALRPSSLDLDDVDLGRPPPLAREQPPLRAVHALGVGAGGEALRDGALVAKLAPHGVAAAAAGRGGEPVAARMLGAGVWDCGANASIRRVAALQRMQHGQLMQGAEEATLTGRMCTATCRRWRSCSQLQGRAGGWAGKV